MWGGAVVGLSGLGLFATTGLEWSQGDYGLEEDTTTVIAPLSVEMNLGSTFLRASTSYATLEGPADIFLIDGVAQPTRRGALGATESRSGFSDLALTAGYGWRPAASSAWLLDLSAGVELPTGDEEEGLGTGGIDYFTGLELIHDADAVIWSASLGYEVIDAPEGFAFEDPWSAGVSATRRLGRSGYVGAALDAREALVVDADESVDVTIFAGRSLAGPVSIGGHVFTGLTDASPEIGAGVTLSWRP